MHKLSIKILTGVGVLVVILGMLYAVMLARATGRLRQAYADLQKDGRPLQAADVIPPEVPDVQNAAVLYESAALLLKAQPSPEADQSGDDRPGRQQDLLGYLGSQARAFTQETLDPNKHAEFRQLLGQEVVTSALSVIEQGAQRPACRFDHSYSNGIPMNSYLADQRMLTSIVGAKACLEAQAGRPEAAWDLVQVQMKMADGMRTEPLFMSQLTRMALIGQSCSTIQKLAGVTLPNGRQYDGLMALLNTLDDIRPLVLAADGERLLCGEWLFTLPRKELYQELRQMLAPDYWPEIVHRARFFLVTFKPIFLGDHAAYLQLMRKQTQLLGETYTLEGRDSLDRELTAVPRRYSLTQSLTPSLGRIRELHCRLAAEVRVARTGLALLRYRETRGGFPEALEALRLKDTNDPFTGKPLLYRAEDKGFLLYSVGEDLKDNGGRVRQGKQHTDFDLVWRFPGRPMP
jgi:hypothetical protein